MESQIGIEAFSWSLFWAGALGAVLVDLSRWIARLQTRSLPTKVQYQATASLLAVIVGGATSGLCADLVTATWQAAAIGASAPGLLRVLALYSPKLLEQVLAKRLLPGDRWTRVDK